MIFGHFRENIQFYNWRKFVNKLRRNEKRPLGNLTHYVIYGKQFKKQKSIVFWVLDSYRFIISWYLFLEPHYIEFTQGCRRSLPY